MRASKPAGNPKDLWEKEVSKLVVQLALGTIMLVRQQSKSNCLPATQIQGLRGFHLWCFTLLSHLAAEGHLDAGQIQASVLSPLCQLRSSSSALPQHSKQLAKAAQFILQLEAPALRHTSVHARHL